MSSDSLWSNAHMLLIWWAMHRARLPSFPHTKNRRNRASYLTKEFIGNSNSFLSNSRISFACVYALYLLKTVTRWKLLGKSRRIYEYLVPRAFWRFQARTGISLCASCQGSHWCCCGPEHPVYQIPKQSAQQIKCGSSGFGPDPVNYLY